MRAANVRVFDLHLVDVLVQESAKNLLVTVADRIDADFNFLVIFAGLFFIVDVLLQIFGLTIKREFKNG